MDYNSLSDGCQLRIDYRTTILDTPFPKLFDLNEIVRLVNRWWKLRRWSHVDWVPGCGRSIGPFDTSNSSNDRLQLQLHSFRLQAFLNYITSCNPVHGLQRDLLHHSGANLSNCGLQIILGCHLSNRWHHLVHPHVLLHHPNEQTKTSSIQQKLCPCLTRTYKRNSSIPEANSGSEIEREEEID